MEQQQQQPALKVEQFEQLGQQFDGEEEKSFFKKTSTMETISTACLSDVGTTSSCFISTKNHDLRTTTTTTTQEIILVAAEDEEESSSTNDHHDCITTSSSSSKDENENPFHQTLANVLGKTVQQWKDQQADKRQKEDELVRRQLVHEAQSPKGRRKQERLLEFALFGEEALAMTESRDEDDSTSAQNLLFTRTNEKELHNGLLVSKTKELEDVLSVRTENSTPADSDNEDDDDIYLHLVPNDDTVPRLLSKGIMKELLVQGMPSTLHGRWWNRLFSITRDGDSFDTFLNKVAGYDHTLIVVQTTRGEVIGGFADSAWDQTRDEEFFGMGTSFLFSLADDSSLQLFKWTGENMYNQVARRKEHGGCIGMGGGGSGSFGLMLQREFTKGSSGACDTYGNTSSLTKQQECFDILNFEVYGFERYW